MLTELQKRAAQAIVNIFETSKVLGDYASVVFVPGDRGGLTYGKTQTTINSGNLYLLIKAYTETDGALFASALRSYLERLREMDQRLNTDMTLRGILEQAGKQDPVMIDAQDDFFDRVYWAPAANRAAAIGAQTALGASIVYDGTVHGAWPSIRDRTIARHGELSAIGERKWFSHYVSVRREWLAGRPPSTLLPRTVYRMDAFRQIIDVPNWDLKLPLTVRGLLIDEHTLTPPIVTRPVEPPRQLKLANPFMSGEDVRQLQRALDRVGIDIGEGGADGIFGADTDAAVKSFQLREGLRVDGVVGSATRSALGIDVD